MALLLTGCTGAGAPGQGDDDAGGAAGLLSTPATFRGLLPCADCPGIDATLTLVPDQTYRLRMVYRERGPDAVNLELGVWVDEGGTLRLRSGQDGEMVFGKVHADTLRPLDGGGAVLPAGTSFALVRSPDVDRVEDPMILRGMMTSLPGAASFVECATGVSFDLAPGMEFPAAERAYLAARLDPGEGLLVSVRGSLLWPPGAGGQASALEVHAFLEAWPGSGCGSEVVAAPLEGTEWRLVDLPGGAPLPDGAHATLLLDPETHASSGSTGCDGFRGAYRLEGGRLTVGVTSLAGQACEESVAALHADYLEALRVTGAYRFREGRLELLGEGGAVARFEAEVR